MAEQHPIPTDHRFKDLTGKRFGRLTVMAYAGTSGNGRSKRWVVRCDCGTEKVMFAVAFLYQYTISCGCYRKTKFLRHGASDTVEHNAWMEIKRRCYDPRRRSYYLYGGRGISMCDEWRNSFEAFFRDMGLKPTKDHSIERRDVNGHYCPENCYWATRIEQANNTRTNHRLEYGGETHTMAEWSRLTGINVYRISERINSGWSAERALTTPVAHRPPKP